MLRTVQTSQLKLGMFIHSMEGSWFDHPFWRSRFLLTEDKQLGLIVASGVDRVTIDESKGKSMPVASSEAGKPSMRSSLVSPVQMKTLVARPRSYLHTDTEPSFNRLTPPERAAATRRASGTIKRSRTAVMNLFEDARLGNSVKTRKLAPLVDQISESVSLDPAIMLNMARLKTNDDYTYLHSVAVCALMINLARKMGVPETQIPDVGMAGLLHDIGKESIPESILSKPGQLSEEEWVTVWKHPQRGHDILSASKEVGEIALEVCLRHHEKMDGTGYPGGVAADNFSIFSRMSAVCDVYDAITSQRPYNTPLSASGALAKMQSFSGHFDQLILRDFVDSLGILPVGTLVRLDQDELAMVIGESPSNYAAPIVRSFRSLDEDRDIVPKDIDTGRNRRRKLLAIEDPSDWGFSDWPRFSEELLNKPAAT